MPILDLQTNVLAGAIREEFVHQTVDVVAQALGKPASYVVVNITAGQVNKLSTNYARN